MSRAKSLVHLSLAIVLNLGAFAGAHAQAKLSADQIVSRNIVASGGLQAWRQVQTFALSGKMQAGSNPPPLPSLLPHRGSRPQITEPKPVSQIELPFRMDLKRGRKSRLELDFNGQTALQIYDGTNGWLKRPYLNRTDYEPYTPEQTKTAADQSDLDGPVIDYAAKGTVIELAGTEKVDGQDNYKLKLTMKNGYSFHVWIDAQTFLQTKMEGTPRRLDGQMRPVEIYMKDYRSVNGLKIPFVLETRVSYLAPHSKQAQIITETITLENAVVNPQLDDSLFVRPKDEAKPKSEVATNSSHGGAQ
jgi:outer membrane lipoprotein-sorting protein